MTTKHRIFAMSVARVYPYYVAKAEKKGRKKSEVDAIICWLTGYTQREFAGQLKKQTDFETFFKKAPKLNPARALIKGVVCGIRVEDIQDPTMREIRYLDKLVDELAKGKAMEKILRSEPSATANPAIALVSKTPSKAGAKSKPVKLLSGGNPQIAKADGDAPVQAYIAAMPGWKHGLGKRLDAIIARNAPHAHKAVRWNSPFYGVEGQGWFLAIHCLTKYVKVTFFAGMSLRPIPPGGTEKSKAARWLDIYEDDELDEAQMATWVKQAAALPGWIP